MTAAEAPGLSADAGGDATSGRARAAGDRQPTLERVVGRWQIVGVAVNDVVGSGIYLLPAAAALLLGPASLWAVALAGFAVLLVVLCFAEAASHFDQPGGAYLYARAAFGELIGFEVGWMTWLARVSSVASLSVGFAQALSWLLPGAAEGWGRTVTVTLVLVLPTAANVIGVRWGVGLAVGLAVAKLLPLGLFVAAGLVAARWDQVAAQPAGDGGIGEAALLLLFAYAGFENTPAPAGEYRRPRRDVPFALVTQILFVTVLYLAVQWVALGTLPEIGRSSTPLADSAQRFLGPWAGGLLAVGGVLAVFGTLGNTVLVGPRYLYALALDRYGPAFLAGVHPRFRTPASAIVLQTAVALPLALTGSFVGLAALSVVARLATYLGTAAALPVLRRRLAGSPGAFRLPGGALIPVAACLVTVVLAASATWINLVAALVALAVGYLVFRLRRPASAGS